VPNLIALCVSTLKALFPLAANRECVADYKIYFRRVLTVTGAVFVYKHCAERRGDVRADTGIVCIR
jgi:hypothetical protein